VFSTIRKLVICASSGIRNTTSFAPRRNLLYMGVRIIIRTNQKNKVCFVLQRPTVYRNSINHRFCCITIGFSLNNRNYVLNTYISLFCCAINAACIYINIINGILWYRRKSPKMIELGTFSKITLLFTITATQYQQNSVAILSFA
jgi:hypothetical protein